MILPLLLWDHARPYYSWRSSSGSYWKKATAPAAAERTGLKEKEWKKCLFQSQTPPSSRTLRNQGKTKLANEEKPENEEEATID